MDIELMIADYVQPELFILIPVLYFIGVMLKRTENVADNYIPIVLGVIGIIMACVWVVGYGGLCAESAFVGITQGILCAGCSVYVNQLIVQTKKNGGGE
jgi:hypothetical protein